jgi:hypothetical protein
MENRVAFLLGAGASIDAGMPKTDEITDGVLNPNTEVMQGYEDPNCIKTLANLCKGFQEKWINYRSSLSPKPNYSSDPNYEDIYYLAYQLHSTSFSDNTSEFENPAIEPFIREYKSQFGLGDYDYWAERVCKYIEEVVVRLINKRSANNIEYNSEYLTPLLDYSIASCDHLDIFTLNHDLVIDDYFKRKGTNYSDGFVKIECCDSSFLLEPTIYDDSIVTNLYKIHGSIDWQRVKLNNSDRDCTIKGSINDKNYWIPEPIEHQILCGTMNKMFIYHFSIFAELWARFYLTLMKSNKLVVAGYGFGDRAVTNAIIHWIYRDKRKMIIIDNKSKDDFIKELNIISPSFARCRSL